MTEKVINAVARQTSKRIRLVRALLYFLILGSLLPVRVEDDTI